MTAVPATLFDAGIGLPPAYNVGGPRQSCWHFAEDWRLYPDRVQLSSVLWLGCPQTAYGVALKLDEWERGRAGGHPPMHWSTETDRAIRAGALGTFAHILAARVAHIGESGVERG